MRPAWSPPALRGCGELGGGSVLSAPLAFRESAFGRPLRGAGAGGSLCRPGPAGRVRGAEEP